MAINPVNWTSNIGNMSFQEISAKVQDSMPPNTFSSIKTASEPHFFAGQGNLASRKIVLERTRIACAIEVLKCFFLTIFSPNKAARIGYGEMGNNNSLMNFVTGEDMGEDNAEEVRKAFVNCRTVTIFITEDGGFADIEVRDSTALVTARIVGKLIRRHRTDSSNIVELMKSNPNISNEMISEIIKAKLPADTYTPVNVTSIQHHFYGLGQVAAKYIELIPPPSNLLTRFQGLGHNKQAVDENTLRNYILGVNEFRASEETFRQEGEEVIKTAWKDRRSICIYITQNGEFPKLEIH